MNVLLLASGPSVAELASVGVRRVSTGGALAGFAYGALIEGARELLEEGTSHYSDRGIARDLLTDALGIVARSSKYAPGGLGTITAPRGYSSVGRAPGSHPGGRRFEPG